LPGQTGCPVLHCPVVVENETVAGEWIAGLNIAVVTGMVGYDLAGFFKRNTEALREEVAKVLDALLRAE